MDDLGRAAAAMTGLSLLDRVWNDELHGSHLQFAFQSLIVAGRDYLDIRLNDCWD